jgi:hypothetical protein
MNRPGKNGKKPFGVYESAEWYLLGNALEEELRLRCAEFEALRWRTICVRYFAH